MSKQGRPPAQTVPTLMHYRRMLSIMQILRRYDDDQDEAGLCLTILHFCDGWGVEPAYLEDESLDIVGTLARLATHANEAGKRNHLDNT